MMGNFRPLEFDGFKGVEFDPFKKENLTMADSPHFKIKAKQKIKY